MYFLCIIFVGVFEFCNCGVSGWGYINLHCRDNDNKPVDWWYIYKPPSITFPLRAGLNFTYITSETAGRWLASSISLNGNSMLVNTLMPMYKRSYANHLAVAVYQNRHGDASSRTSARGVLMADEMGGFLLTHTVPAFPDIHISRPTFPPSETVIGHLLVCVSLDMETLNNVSAALHRISPKFTYVKIPDAFRKWLHEWDFLQTTPDLRSSRKLSNIDFQTRGNTSASLIVRPPGSNNCLYKHFAEQQQINLNVYGQSRSEYLTSVCAPGFGVRNIDAISVKFREEVYYMVNCTDRTWFAVSTAAHWQQRGAGPVQYWTCTSNVDKDNVNDGAGLLLCIEDYSIWRTFDNLKVKEPEC